MSELHYRFGPLDKPGLLFGLGAPQLGTVLGGLLLAIVALHLSDAFVGAALALLVVVLAGLAAVWPLAGRTPVSWVPVGGCWLWRRATGRHRFVAHTPVIGRTVVDEATAAMPPWLHGLTLLAAPVVGGEIGIIKDPSNHSYTAVIAVRGRSFALIDHHTKRRMLEEWADVISGLGREGSPIKRVQWVERTVADTGDDVGSYLRDNVALPHGSSPVRSYLQLVDDAGPVSQQHESFMVVQIDGIRGRRGIRLAGGGDQGACTVLAREVYSLAMRLQGAELEVVGLLTPRMVSQCIRVAYDPQARGPIVRRGKDDETMRGVAPHDTWPHATYTTWTNHRTDSAVHATYWISEWPRMDVGPDFLAPILLQTWVQRTVSVTMEPVSPLKAQRQVENARTAGVADEDLRQRAGFMMTMRRQRAHENVMRREQELADGHADVRFTGYVTVSARDVDELEIACSEVEQAAGQSRLVLRRMVGEQDVAFTYTLPLARGLR